MISHPGRKRGWRALPRWKRWAVVGVTALVYAAVMWFFVFPWVDRTFVNRPSI